MVRAYEGPFPKLAEEWLSDCPKRNAPAHLRERLDTITRDGEGTPL